GRVAARGGEWCGRSCRSGEGEYFLGSPEKLAGKVFRRRRWVAGGGRRQEGRRSWWWCGEGDGGSNGGGVGCGRGRRGEWRRVVASGVVDLVDRVKGSIFGVRQKSFPAAMTAAVGGRRWPAAGREEEVLIDKLIMLEVMVGISLDSMLDKWHKISKDITHGRMELPIRVDMVMLLLLGLRVLEWGIKPGIQLQAEEFDFMAAAGDLDEIEEVNANCILMANLQHASTSGTQLDKAPLYDTDGSAEEWARVDPYTAIPE
nr:hypothetical protein [Tanacetum cinerariifolium]